MKAGSLLSWADRILALCHSGDFLSAIRLATAYYTNTAPGNYIGLSADEQVRQGMLKARILGLLRSSLSYAFSEDRMTDGTYESSDGRGVDLTSLFEGLASICLDTCLTIGEPSFAFEDAYEAFQQAGIQNMYLEKLEGILLQTRLKGVPPNLVQALIRLHDERGEYAKAQNIIWHVEPLSLDINQAITLCEQHSLWDAYVYVYNQCLMDFVTPIAKFINLMEPVGEADYNTEHLPQAYAVFQYLAAVLIGLEYPDRRPLDEAEAAAARRDVYGCLFGIHDVLNDKSQISVELDPYRYPVLRRMLHYDTEAFLHVLDIAFEDGYLNESQHTEQDRDSFSRQKGVDALLEVMTPEDFPTGDITFLHIFIARNLPKYPQFLKLPSETAHQILISLARDPDITSRGDRQLAAEHLLSVYNPPKVDERRQFFRQAGFFEILRQDYAKSGDWAEMLRSAVDDPDLEPMEIFNVHIRQALESSQAPKVLQTLEDLLSQMLGISILLTARIVEDIVPQYHQRCLELLEDNEIKQLAYLGAVLQPEMEAENESLVENAEMEIQDVVRRTSPLMTRLNQSDVQHYIRLLCRHAREQLLDFLQHHTALINLSMAIDSCEAEQEISAAIWALNANDEPQKAISRSNRFIEEESQKLRAMTTSEDGEYIQSSLRRLEETISVAIDICVSRQDLLFESSKQKDAQDHHSLSETLWFDLLAKLVHVAQVSLQDEPEIVDLDSLEPSSGSTTLLISRLRQGIQDTLAALISSSASSTLSFPRLFRRLVQTSENDLGQLSDQASPSSAVYSEFRLVLFSMLNTYHDQQDTLILVTKLIQGELCHWLNQMVINRQAGWRAQGLHCGYCKKRFSNRRLDRKTKAGMVDTARVRQESENAICVPRTGLPYHWDCTQ